MNKKVQSPEKVQESTGTALSLRNVTKKYGQLAAVDGVSMEVSQGEFVTMLGPSGSGKTTTLQIVAGFESATSGDLLASGKPLIAPPYKRDIGMVFQNYALFPHMNAFKNVEYPLKIRRVSKGERRRRVIEALDMVGLSDRGAHNPKQLSGGQQQRVALARALVFRPKMVLLDEPLGALDKKLRENLQLEIKRIQKELGITMLYVTHDQEEALVMSDRIAVFNEGKIEQIGTSEEIYERPASLFVANFIGESNVFQGRLEDSNTSTCLVHGDLRLDAPSDLRQHVVGNECALIVRPEKMQVTSSDSRTVAYDNVVETVVEQVIYLGSERKYMLKTADGDRLVSRQQSGQDAQSATVGASVLAVWNANDGVLAPL